MRFTGAQGELLMRGVAGLVASALVATSLLAQWTSPIQSAARAPRRMGAQSTIEGRIDLRGVDATDLQVLLIDQSGNQTQAEVSSNGSFSFPTVAYGEYELSLLERGKPVSERDVQVDSMVESVDLALPKDRGAHSGDDTVSVSEMQHKPPPQARKEAKKGQDAVHETKGRRSHRPFRERAGHRSGFHRGTGRTGEAVSAKHDDARAVPLLETFLKQRSGSVWAWASLSAARFRLGRIADAETAARRSLTLEPAQPIGRYILGISLASLNKEPEEALACLRKSLGQFPQGHLAIAKILAVRGDMAGARTELQSYVDSYPDTDTTGVRAWLDEHQGPQSSVEADVAPAK